MAEQTFFAPTTLDEAISILANLGEKGTPLAGGTDLMPRFNRHRVKRDISLVYLGKAGLDYIRMEGDTVVVGSCTTLANIIEHPLIKKHIPLLAKSCSQIAGPAVRNAATLGGNLGTNARAADGVAALLALGATVVTASPSGEQRTAVETFISAPRKDRLAPGTLIKEFEIPRLGDNEKWGWEKLGQRMGVSRSIVTASTRATIRDGVCLKLRLVLGCMSAHPFVSCSASGLLEGKPLSKALIEDAVDGAIRESSPATDTRATAWYREQAARVLTRRVLSQLS